MQFVYFEECKKEFIEVEGEVYNYLFKVRREKKGDIVPFRNLKDDFLYYYKIEDVTRKKAFLSLVSKEKKEVLPKRYFHLIWCVIDPKTIEKTLPTLNEIGVSKITFVYCDRSQKNFRLKFEKLNKILINSCQQCGRSRLMELEVLKDLNEILLRYDNIIIINFHKEKLNCADNIKRALIGPEGGFSVRENKMFQNLKTKGFDTDMILKSESAAISVSAKILY